MVIILLACFASLIQPDICLKIISSVLQGAIKMFATEESNVSQKKLFGVKQSNPDSLCWHNNVAAVPLKGILQRMARPKNSEIPLPVHSFK